ncbi:hypothetical protein [Undibacterium sp. YM2]|uniref:hypothetical protein n=1 Tax=Undibacterium sp. YM2 TaxID=2058625 RepID=UPI0013893EE2|nr:hypothetical protein [Undibacterium sp. YM2]
MSAHYLVLVTCSLLMYAQYSCASESNSAASADAAEPPPGLATPQAVNVAQEPVEPGARADTSTQAELNGPPVPAVSKAQLAGRSEKTQSANGPDLYTRVTKEYYAQSANPASRQEKPGSLSRFGLGYSQSGNDHLWLEYRFNEKAAIRLRGAAHRGVRLMAVVEY